MIFVKNARRPLRGLFCQGDCFTHRWSTDLSAGRCRRIETTIKTALFSMALHKSFLYSNASFNFIYSMHASVKLYLIVIYNNTWLVIVQNGVERKKLTSNSFYVKNNVEGIVSNLSRNCFLSVSLCRVWI